MCQSDTRFVVESRSKVVPSFSHPVKKHLCIKPVTFQLQHLLFYWPRSNSDQDDQLQNQTARRLQVNFQSGHGTQLGNVNPQNALTVYKWTMEGRGWLPLPVSLVEIGAHSFNVYFINLWQMNYSIKSERQSPTAKILPA